jgi:hypothetical protein
MPAPEHSARSERAPRPDRAARRERPAGPERAPRAERPGRADRQERRPGWDQFGAFGSDTDTDTDLPPWAGPPVYAARPGGTQLRPPAPADDYGDDGHLDPWEGDERPAWPEEEARPAGGDAQPRPEGRRAGRRAAAARLRKSRRRVLRWSGVAIAACVIAGLVVILTTHHKTSNLPYVTSLQKGEFKSVPDACTAMSPSLLNSYLPPSGRTMVQSLAGPTDSQCTYTVDSKPDFLVLSIGTQSYLPFAAATGNGSASQNALDNFADARLLLASPPKKSPLPPASISTLPGTGQRAFVAVQLEHAGKIATDAVTVSVLERNVIITIALSAQESGGYGPVPVSTLEADAQTVARAVLQKAMAQPTA